MPRLSSVFARMLCLASCALAACHPSSTPERPDAGIPFSSPPPASTPPSLYAGPGATPFLQVLARGTQTYTCVFTDGGSAAWGAAVPDATLDAALPGGGAVGRHFAGPTWEWAADKSTFVGSKVAAEGFASIPSPDDAGANVPWLLLPRKTGTDGGMLAPATFVQRLNTQGGMVTNQPLGCDAAAADAGRVVRVPYRATYVFYRNAAAGGR